MSVLTLLLAGPLQSWGATARFARRATENAPTKSGVLGLLAAAQGRPRSGDISDLAALRFGVRIDQPGVRIRDYQTAHHADSGESMPVSERFYLADAVFVAAVEGDEALIDDLHQATQAPAELPYLGRRSCPPARPIDLRVHESGDVETALAEEEWRAADWYQRSRRREPVVELTTLLDASPSEEGADTARDVPVSFDPLHRQYRMRGIVATSVRVRNPKARSDTPPDHDPLTVLEDA